MFENLTEKLQRTFKNLRGQGKLTDEHLNTALAEIREALLEGDVNVGVADELLANIRAKAIGSEVILVDTAGRLHIDDELMNELSTLKKELQPSEILFIADSMIGQDAVRSAGEFHKRLGLTGVILTKLDGDARGGAALSIGKVTGAPVKFVGLGEKYDALEGFYPERIVSRVLGMGDLMSLIKRVQQTVDTKAPAK